MQLNFKVIGRGKPLILLHGLFGSLENLGRIGRSLSGHFEVHLLDLRNHGRSPHSAEMNLDVMAQDIDDYARRMNLDKLSMLGHSLGGKVAMQYAVTYQSKVEKLIVVDIAPVSYPPRHLEIFKGLRLIEVRQPMNRNQADELLGAFVDEPDIRQFLLKNLLFGKEGVSWRINLNAIESCYERLLEGIDIRRRYNGPVLFVAGGLSDYIAPECRHTVLSIFPEAAFRQIPDAGHWLHVQKPQLFAGICSRFLSS